MPTGKLMDDFGADGFVVLPGVLSSSEVEELRRAAESDAIEERQLKLGGADDIVHQTDVTSQHATFAAFAVHTGVLDAVEQIIGADIQLHHSKLASKPLVAGKGEFHWHQDFPFMPHTNTDLVAAFLYLDDATVENGCMSMIPGSYLLGPLSHTDRRGCFTAYCTGMGKVLDDHEVVAVEAKAGDISIHHCLTLHCSPPNATGRPRRGLVYEYRASDAAQLGGPVYSDTGRQVRGTFRGTVRCEAGVMNLPFFPWDGSPTYGLYSRVSPGLEPDAEPRP